MSISLEPQSAAGCATDSLCGGQPCSGGGCRTAAVAARPPANILLPRRESVTTIASDGSRPFIHAAQAKGRFTNWRAVVASVLMAVYVGLPWIPVNGAPAVFLDIANLQFHFFGLTFVSQDLWIAFFLITGLAFSLFYVSALFGRVWCGWGCPQTVFLDIARRFERWCEGDAPARRRLDAAPSSPGKMFRRVIKNTLYAGFALLLAHILLSYFVSLPRLYAMIAQKPAENWGAFLFVFGVAGALWFDFAWFREQFCIVLCPYGRLQSALVDDDTVVVAYDSTRGEPRGRKGTVGAADCVDCRRCVQVCPTGIDIRQGLQIECIGCAACVDACDTVMTKLDRAPGLIRHTSTRALSGERTRWIRPRIILYTALLLLGAGATLLGLSTIKLATVSLTRLPGIPYVVSGDDVRNEFLLRVLNKRSEPVTFDVAIEGASSGVRFQGGEAGVDVPALGEKMIPIIVTIPRAQLRGKLPLRFRVAGRQGGTVIEKDVAFVGPNSYL